MLDPFSMYGLRAIMLLKICINMFEICCLICFFLPINKLTAACSSASSKSAKSAKSTSVD